MLAVSTYCTWPEATSSRRCPSRTMSGKRWAGFPFGSTRTSSSRARCSWTPPMPSSCSPRRRDTSNEEAARRPPRNAACTSHPKSRAAESARHEPSGRSSCNWENGSGLRPPTSSTSRTAPRSGPWRQAPGRPHRPGRRRGLEPSRRRRSPTVERTRFLSGSPASRSDPTEERTDLLARGERAHPPRDRRPRVRDAGLQRRRAHRTGARLPDATMKRPGPTTTATVWKVRGARPSRELDQLAAEEPMEVRVESGAKGQRETTSLSVTMRTPGHDFELAAGFLFTEGIVARKGDIARIEYCTDPGVAQEYNIVSAVLRPDVEFRADRLTRHFYMTSSCGVCGKTALDAVRVAVRYPIPPGEPMLGPKTVAAIPERLRKDQALFFSEIGRAHV